MRVRLIQPVRIAADGYHSEHCVEGQVLDLPAALALGLIRDGLAVEESGVAAPAAAPTGEPEAQEELQPEKAEPPKPAVRAARKQEYR